LLGGSETNGGGAGPIHSRYKTSMCRDLTTHSSCPRGKHCTFAHSQGEIEQ
jgi:RING finger/CCCH-type zinc finger protein